jgi:hypothetical protein
LGAKDYEDPKPMGRLRYIWSDRRYLIHRRQEKLLLWFVWRLPRTLVMWCAVRVHAHATTGRYGNTNPGDLTIMEAMKRWEGPNTDLPRDGLPTEQDFATIPEDPKGHVVTASKQDKQWRPHQQGGVIVAEPDAMTMARERGEDVDDIKTD